LKAADWDHTNHYSIDYRKLEEEISRLTNSDVSINMKHLHRSARLMLIDGNESAASVSMPDTVHITENHNHAARKHQAALGMPRVSICHRKSGFWFG